MSPPPKRFAFPNSKRLFLVGPDIPNKGFPEKRDFCWTKPGELLGAGGPSCSSPKCGCDRSFTGVDTRRATTIGIVVERDVSELTAHYESAGRAWPGMEGIADQERRDANALVDTLTIRRFPVGTLVRIQWQKGATGREYFSLSEVKRMPKSPPPGRRRNPDGFWTPGPRVNPGSLRWRPMVWHSFRGGRGTANGDIYASFVIGRNGQTTVTFQIWASTIRGKFGPKTKELRVIVDAEGLPNLEYSIQGKTRDELKRRAQQIAEISQKKGWLDLGPTTRVNPARPHDLVDIVDARTGRVIESRISRYVASNNAWLFRHDGHKVKIVPHRPAKGSKGSRRSNPSPERLRPVYDSRAFPGWRYYNDVAIPAGFIAQHYRNDVAPRWVHPGKRLVLWIDSVNPAEREHGGRRFTLARTNADFDDDEDPPIISTDSYLELTKALRKFMPKRDRRRLS